MDNDALRFNVSRPDRMLTFSEHLERIGFRGPGFDRVRVIAALVVVLHHSSFYSMQNIADDFLNTASGGAINFGRLAVNVFFITSGVLVAPGLLRSGDLLAFIANRFLRIMPALLVVVIATVFLLGPVITVLTTRQYFSDPDTYLYLKNITFRTVRYLPGVQNEAGSPIIVNGALWTIYFEVLSYMTLALLFVTGITKRPKVLPFLLCAVYCVYLYSYLFPTNPLHIHDSLVIFCQLFLYFLAGVCIVTLSEFIPYSGKIASVLLVVTLASFPAGVGYYILPITLSYIVAYVGYSNLLGSKRLDVDLSYGIYLIHSLVITFIAIMVPLIDNFFIAVPIVVAITVSLAFLSWRFIEEPCLRRKKLASSVIRSLLGIIRSRQTKVETSTFGDRRN